MTEPDRATNSIYTSLANSLSEIEELTAVRDAMASEIEDNNAQLTLFKSALHSALRDANVVVRDKWWRRTKFLRRSSNTLRKIKGKPIKHWPKEFKIESYLNGALERGAVRATQRATRTSIANDRIPRVSYTKVREDFVKFAPTPPLATIPKLIAFYLPQFHPFPENDKWWGKGFTEWTNVGKAKSYFPNHYQPHCPVHLGYYDLRNPEVMEEQAFLARANGISGFAYYFYWFAGKVLMETPLMQMLNNKKVDIPFCMIWANENWTRRWDGQENDVLISQNHSIEDSKNLLSYLRPFLDDSRYIKINGKPLFIIYRADIIPEIKETIQAWRQQAVEFGFPGIYVVCAQTFNHRDPNKYGFDAAMEFPPHTVVSEEISSEIEMLEPSFSGNIYDYDQVVSNAVRKKNDSFKVFPTSMLSWDNTARKGVNGNIFARFTVSLYAQWLSSNAERISKDERLSLDENLIFVNAWNEWAEGTHLEPDNKHGFGYLAATRSVMSNYEVSKISFAKPNYPKEAGSKFAIIIHLHYEETWEEIKEAILRVSSLSPDIFITVTSIALADLVIKDFPSAVVELLDNRGRDIRPFIHVLKKIDYLAYTAICKVHGKASAYRTDGEFLRKTSLDALLQESVVSMFADDKTVGMIVPEMSLISHTEKNLTYSGAMTENLAKQLSIREWQGKFPAGSMFWFRPEALKTLNSIDTADFDIERGLADGTLAHAVERLFCSVCIANGFSVNTTGQKNA